MFTVICGEDVITSRDYLRELQLTYRKKSIEVQNITADEVAEITRWLGDSPTLFSEKKILFTQFLDKKIKKDSKKMLDDLVQINSLKDVELVDWEDASSRDLKIGKIGKVKEFKPSKTIFKLLDTVYPGNKVVFLNFLSSLSRDVDENFIFLMLARYVRNLILVKQEIMPTRMQSWQFGKLRYVAKVWKLETLILFYEGLMRIDIASKTGKSPYSIKESLDILACYYL